MEPLSADDPRTIGEFRLHARLGAGGMGQVYLGFSPAGRAVAIKVVHAQFARDQEFLRRFSREVAAAGAVSGMYTAPVVGSGLADNPPWLATAFVPGPPLATVVGRHGPLPEAAVWRLAAGLAEALRAVHAAGLIHRDLKPANVLLADDGPHVIDFGISRAFHGTQLTSAGMVVGTPGYMSPEQAEGMASGPASDIFSLGCVLAYAATGKPPFGEGTAAAVLFRVVTSEPDLSAVPPNLRQLIESCVRKDPAQRPGPDRLIAMISALGPATAATLGSFWPDAVARVIAAEQASQTPAGLTPPRSAAAGAPAAALSGPAAPASPARAERTPTALATPPPGPGAGIGTGPGAAGSTGSSTGSTGHAPMISDGYYAAAQRPSGPTPMASGPSMPPVPSPAVSPQPYSGQQPYVAQLPGAQAPPGSPPAGQAPFGQPSFGQPSFGQAWPYGGQPPSYPGQQYPGQRPGAPDAISRYTPGRRKPMAAEVPPAVRNALRLMYAGFVLTVVDLVLSGLAENRYTSAVSLDQGLGRTAAANHANSMAGSLGIGIVADILGLVCWAWLAVACRRGRGWTRVAGTVLLGIYTICTLVVELGTKDDPGPRFTTLVVWILGVAATIPLWSQQAREFFSTWRKR